MTTCLLNAYCWVLGLLDFLFRPPSQSAGAARRRPALEPLEDRLAPAVAGVWTGGGKSGSWFDAQNWQGGAIPQGPDDTATFGAILPGRQSPVLTATRPGQTLTLAALTINSNFGNQHTLRLQRVLTVNKTFVMDSGILENFSAFRNGLILAPTAKGTWDGGTWFHLDANVASNNAARAFTIGGKAGTSGPQFDTSSLTVLAGAFAQMTSPVLDLSGGQIYNSGTFTVTTATGRIFNNNNPNNEGEIENHSGSLFRVASAAGVSSKILIEQVSFIFDPRSVLRVEGTATLTVSTPSIGFRGATVETARAAVVSFAYIGTARSVPFAVFEDTQFRALARARGLVALADTLAGTITFAGHFVFRGNVEVYNTTTVRFLAGTLENILSPGR